MKCYTESLNNELYFGAGGWKGEKLAVVRVRMTTLCMYVILKEAISMVVRVVLPPSVVVSTNQHGLCN